MEELETDLDLLGSLSGVLDKRSAYPGASSAEGHVPVFEVMKLIGERNGIQFKNSRPDLDRQERPEDTLVRVCNSSGIRWRKVALEAGWMKLDAGDMLLFADTGKPYAALRQKNSYTLHTDRAGTGLNPGATRLQGYGYVFYKGFPEGRLTLGRIIRLCVGEVKNELRLVVFCNALIGLLSVFLPAMIGVIFQDILPESNIGRLNMVLAGLLISAVAVTAFHYVNKYALLRIESRLSIYLQSALWDKLLTQPVAFFKNYPSGEMAQRALGINTIRQLISGSTIASLTGSVFMVFYFVLLLYYSVPLAILSVLLILVFSTINFALLKKELYFQRKAYDINGEITGEMVQHVNAITKLKMASAERFIVGRWTKLFGKEKKAEYDAARYTNWVEVANITAPLFSSLLLYAVPVYGELEISIAVFISFQATFALFLATGISFSNSLLNFFKAIPIYKRLEPIVETGPENKPDIGIAEVRGKIEVRHVSFRHEQNGRLVLDNVSLSAEPGEFIAITGPSGSGKSTLIKLILGFFEPEAGTVFIDDHDISRINLQAIRKRLGVVLQSDGVMQGSILDNIRGAGNYSLAEVEKAVEIADLAEDIKALPMGLNTMIPHGGGSFSGGQLQRIMVARAIVGNPRILIFDEATSALDTISQEKITRALESLSCTKIVIAHRLSTIRKADKTYQIRDGRMFLHDPLKPAGA